jgi:uncharacterized protein
LVLLAFGLIHLFLIWNGDILTEYAVVGLIVLPLLFGPPWLLGAAATVCLLIYLAMPLLPSPVAFPGPAGVANLVRAANDVYGIGSFRQILAFRISEVSSIFPLHVFILPRTLGLFMLGAVIWRSGLVKHADRYSGTLWFAAVILIVIGLAIGLRSNSASNSIAPTNATRNEVRQPVV